MRLYERLRQCALGAAMMALAPPMVQADEVVHARPIGVVELFTSQGCSSCPKADAAIEKLADRTDLITIAFHIDYWNYNGWADTLSAKENTERQYDYAKTLGNANVYTPQIVLNGIVDAKSTDPNLILARLGELKQRGKGADVTIDAHVSHDELTIDIGNGEGKADVVIAHFVRRAEVEIGKGENVGKKIVYRNSVVRLETVGVWDGKSMTIKLPVTASRKKGIDGCAILLQAHDKDGNPGRIYGAAAL